MTMRPWLLLLSFTFACRPASPQPAGDEAALRTAIAGYDSAWKAKDSIRVAQYLAPDYAYFTSTGDLSSRAESFGFLRDTTYWLTRSDRSELDITISGTVARVSSRWMGDGMYQGSVVRDDQTCGLIWTWREQRWQLFSEHCVNRAVSTADSGE